MVLSYKYAVARFSAGSARDERLNVALLVLKPHELDVRLPKSLDKLKAISAAVDLDQVREALDRLPDLDTYVSQGNSGNPDERLRHLRELSALDLSNFGEIVAPTAEHYEMIVNQLLVKLVEPEPSTPKVSYPKASRLLSNVKSAFKVERVLAKKDEDLSAHRIVSNYKVAEGLAADLILKNGAMHVVQVADSSEDVSSARRMIGNIAVSALVFEQARMTFGEAETKAKLVYKATSSLESVITPSLDAAQHQGADLVNWESRVDRMKFIVEMSSLAEPLPSKGGRRAAGNIHASTQAKLSLN